MEYRDEVRDCYELEDHKNPEDFDLPPDKVNELFASSYGAAVEENYDDPVLLYVGAGSGHHIHQGNWDEREIDVVALDLSSSMAEFVYENRGVDSMMADGFHIPFENGSVSALWSGMAHYYGPEAQEQFLEECHRVLDEEGIAAIPFKNRDRRDDFNQEFRENYNLVWRGVKWGIQKLVNWQYPLDEKYDSRDEIAGRAETAGFSVTDFEERDRIREIMLLEKNDAGKNAEWVYSHEDQVIVEKLISEIALDDFVIED